MIIILLLVGAFDAIANGGKAYGNVSINGIDVGGMTEQEMRSALEESIGTKVSNTEVTIESSEGSSDLSDESSESSSDELDLLAESVQAEYSEDTTEWTATSESLKATLPYDEAIKEALAAGRGWGPFSRLGLMFSKVDIPLTVNFDDKAFENLAQNIDKSTGSSRIDATVIVEDGGARALPGRDGKMVDRNTLRGDLTQAFMSNGTEQTVTASIVDAPSRTTLEQAQTTCDAINRALEANATFTYNSKSWSPSSDDLANWTKVIVVEEGDGGRLDIVIDSATAASDLVKGLGAAVSSANVTVSFVVNGDDVRVHTSGSGSIPEIESSLRTLQDELYGKEGYAWNDHASPDISISIAETDAPESLSFDEALGLGLITVIGEYTTEFSDDAGTENRNHNIKLVAEYLNNTVCGANGGTWSFNEHSGDTNQDPPFASAGSIVQGEYVDSIGGGVCQVATTVFNAVFESGLDIDFRANHSLYIASYPDGRDASVSYPDLDLVWSNPLQSDVLLKTSTTDTSVTAQLYSTYTGYRVESETGDWQEGAKYSTKFETDDNLVEGQYYRKSYGEDGKSIQVTRSVYDESGELIDMHVYPSSYAAKDEVYVIGPGTDTSNLVRKNES